MPLYFETDDMPAIGSWVTFEKAGAFEQDYVLLAVAPHGEDSAVMTWASHCTDCDGEFQFTSGPHTSNMYRRCKPCRKAFSRDRVTTWPTGPRMKHRLSDPDPDFVLPAIEARAEPQTAGEKRGRRAFTGAKGKAVEVESLESMARAASKRIAERAAAKREGRPVAEVKETSAAPAETTIERMLREERESMVRSREPVFPEWVNIDTWSVLTPYLKRFPQEQRAEIRDAIFAKGYPLQIPSDDDIDPESLF